MITVFALCWLVPAQAPDTAPDTAPVEAVAPAEGDAAPAEVALDGATKPPGPPTSAPPAASTAPTPATSPTLQIGGTVEAYGAWNFNQPRNGITAFRGFDNRHNTFTLSNAVLDAVAAAGDVSGRLALQIGATPSTYYLAEPALPGSSSANASGAELWKYLQQAWVAWQVPGLPVLEGLQLQAGLFLSPIGPEGILVKDNWNFSRSNLFFGLPFYHAGARATSPSATS